MRIFLKNIILFLILFLIFIYGIFLFNNKPLNNSKKELDYIQEKLINLSKLSKKYKTINFVLGSSLINESIIIDSLNSNWFKFCNPRQNIYESYTFLKHYSNVIDIDTILINIQPFDFPSSYFQNKEGDKPYYNGNFSLLFGEDSIIPSKGVLEKIQKIKSQSFPSLNVIINKLKNLHSLDKSKIHIPYPKIPIDLDSVYQINAKSFNNHLKYFINVNDKPNISYFDLFNELALSLDITVIYLITPKSKYYHIGMREHNYDQLWESIIENIKDRSIILWNYENINTDAFEFHYYFDDVHLSHDAAKVFTKMVKNRLREHKKIK